MTGITENGTLTKFRRSVTMMVGAWSVKELVTSGNTRKMPHDFSSERFELSSSIYVLRGKLGSSVWRRCTGPTVVRVGRGWAWSGVGTWRS